jgi:hypothetical protein
MNGTNYGTDITDINDVYLGTKQSPRLMECKSKPSAAAKKDTTHEDNAKRRHLKI